MWFVSNDLRSSTDIDKRGEENAIAGQKRGRIDDDDEQGEGAKAAKHDDAKVVTKKGQKANQGATIMPSPPSFYYKEECARVFSIHPM